MVIIRKVRLPMAVCLAILITFWAASAIAAPGSRRPKPPKPTPTATVTVSPTATATPTVTATPPPGNSTCPLPEYPTPACTGVPVGTALTELPLNVDNDSYAIDTAGAVLDRVHIPGNLLVRAPNITITNSQIDGVVYNRFGPGSDTQLNTYPYTITDSTIGPATGCIRRAGLQEANYTATRVHIRGVDHGVDVSEPGHAVLQDSFITLCWLDEQAAPPNGSHIDGIQTVCPDGPCVDIRLSHNTMVDPTGKGTFIINIVDPNVAAPVLVEDNLMYGGDNYVIVTYWSGGDNWIIRNNRVVNGTWGQAAPVTTDSTCAHQAWQGNSIVTIDSNWHVTDTIAPLPCID